MVSLTSKLSCFASMVLVLLVVDLSRPLENGDIINIDITVYLDGYHGDTSHTFLVGDVVGPPSLRTWSARISQSSCAG